MHKTLPSSDVSDLAGVSPAVGAAIASNATVKLYLKEQLLSEGEGFFVDSMLSPRKEALLKLQLPSAEGTFNAEMTLDRPVGLLVGPSGCGKSVAAMAIAKQHLAASAGDLVLVTNIEPSVAHSSDWSSRLWHACVELHRDRCHLALIEDFHDVSDYNFPKGSLVIADEFRSHTKGLGDLVKRVRECEAGLVIVLQTFDDVASIHPTLAPEVAFYVRNDIDRGKFWVFQSDERLKGTDFTELFQELKQRLSSS